MLQLILGISGTGKTERTLAEIKVRALAGKKSILLAPEQFSSSAEMMLYSRLGDELSAFAEAYSFTRFAELVLKTFGGVAAQTLTDAARVVAVRRALDRLGDSLPTYSRHRRSTGFCSLCADAITELKTAGASPEILLSAAQAAGNDGAKLAELGQIYAAYEEVIRGSAMDPADRITTAAERMDDRFLADTAIFVDGFDGFTAPEYRMFERLVLAEQCTVTLCCDELADHEAGLGMFSPVKKTAQRLRRIASKQGVSIAAPKWMQEDFRHIGAPALAALNIRLAGGEVVENAGSGIWVTPAAGIYEECKTVACRIAALVRENGLHYGEIAVICRTLDDYAAPLRYEFSLAGIPSFSDETASPEHTAPAVFFLAALELLRKGPVSETILRMLKTDLCGLAPEETAELENYAYTWDLRAEDWRAPFTKNPAGFGAEMTEEDGAALERLEAMRIMVMTPIETFLSAAKREKTAAGISERLYLLLAAFGGDTHTQEAARAHEQAGDLPRARAVYDAWEHIMALLDQMEQLLGTDEVTPAEYAELFALLLHAAQLGSVPQTQDVVILTTADRMRLDRPKVCFVLGVSEGHFPRLLGASGLLSHADRDLLVLKGVEMPGSYVNRTLLEQMFFYRALTSPSQALYVSFVTTETGGAPLSAAMQPVMELQTPSPDTLTEAERAPTPAAALDLLGVCYRSDTPAAAALEEALRRDGSMGASLCAMERACGPVHFFAQDKLRMQKLLGKGLSLSPTRVEQYYHCRFAYFLQSVLKIEPRRKAELSPTGSGSFVHYILEQVMRGAGESFPNLPSEELNRLAQAAADAYIQEYMPGAGRRFTFLIERIRAEVVRLLAFLQEEQRQSAFHPVAFEQVIGEGENAVPPLTLRTPDGHMVRVRGQIDRVDKMVDEATGKTYLRVVDYKTGSKRFSLEEVYCGLNTQMLLYLFTLCRHEQAKGAAGAPIEAGVLYVKADPPPETVARGAEQKTVYQLDGLILNDNAVIRGMDRDATGLFVPFSFNKDQTPSARAAGKLADLEKLGRIEKHIEALVIQMACGLYAGNIDAVPLRDKSTCPCDVCPYRPVCLHEDGRGETYITAPKDPFGPGAPKEGEDGK